MVAKEKEPCQQWLKGKCRRGDDCKYAHPRISLPDLLAGQCKYVIGGSKRCKNNAAITAAESDGEGETDQGVNLEEIGLCSEHTPTGLAKQREQQQQQPAVGKRVSAKSRMVNPLAVQVMAPVLDPKTFADPTLPLVLDIGCARGLWLLQLAERSLKPEHADEAKCNYIGFELREELVHSANENVAKNPELFAKLRYVEGDVTSQLQRVLQPLLDAGANVEWLAVQFPDPWTRTKHLKRRMVGQAFVKACGQIIQPRAGKVFICSDRKDIAAAFYDEFVALPLAAENSDDATDSKRSKRSRPGEEEGKERPPAEGDNKYSGASWGPPVGSSLSLGQEPGKTGDGDDIQRGWVATRPFPVGTERDVVAEKTHRLVHRAVLQRLQ